MEMSFFVRRCVLVMRYAHEADADKVFGLDEIDAHHRVRYVKVAVQ